MFDTVCISMRAYLRGKLLTAEKQQLGKRKNRETPAGPEISKEGGEGGAQRPIKEGGWRERCF